MNRKGCDRCDANPPILWQKAAYSGDYLVELVCEDCVRSHDPKKVKEIPVGEFQKDRPLFRMIPDWAKKKTPNSP